MIQRRLLPAVVVTALALAGCGSAASSSGDASPSAVGGTTAASAGSESAAPSDSGPVSGELTVWVDAVRLPVAKAYQAAHPNVKLNIVTFDGDRERLRKEAVLFQNEWGELRDIGHAARAFHERNGEASHMAQCGQWIRSLQYRYGRKCRLYHFRHLRFHQQGRHPLPQRHTSRHGNGDC